MEKKLKILHLEDLPTDAELVERELKKGSMAFEKLVVDTKEDFMHALHEFKPDIVLSDHSLPSFNSMEALKIVKETAGHIPFILITATVSEEFAVEIMKEGACDYILKDRLQRLPNAVMGAMQMYELAAERKKFLDTVIENEALMTEAEKLAHFGSWEVNMETGTSKWSQEAFRIHGYKQEKKGFSFDRFFENVHEEDFKRLKNMLRNTFDRHRSLLKLDYRLKIENEPDRYVVSELVIKYNTSGKPSRINGFSQDITERKKNEDELRAAAERRKEEEILRKNLKQIADFVRHASHELRTPLATMLLQTENALKKSLQKKNRKKCWNRSKKIS
jgi:DNA-binding response OmpR family regulator